MIYQLLGPFGDHFYNLFDKKHENYLNSDLFRFCLPRGSFCLPSRGWWGEGAGDYFRTRLGVLYIFIYIYWYIYLYKYLLSYLLIHIYWYVDSFIHIYWYIYWHIFYISSIFFNIVPNASTLANWGTSAGRDWRIGGAQAAT